MQTIDFLYLTGVGQLGTDLGVLTSCNSVQPSKLFGLRILLNMSKMFCRKDSNIMFHSGTVYRPIIVYIDINPMQTWLLKCVTLFSGDRVPSSSPTTPAKIIFVELRSAGRCDCPSLGMLVASSSSVMVAVRFSLSSKPSSLLSNISSACKLFKENCVNEYCIMIQAQSHLHLSTNKVTATTLKYLRWIPPTSTTETSSSACKSTVVLNIVRRTFVTLQRKRHGHQHYTVSEKYQRFAEEKRLEI